MDSTFFHNSGLLKEGECLTVYQGITVGPSIIRSHANNLLNMRNYYYINFFLIQVWLVFIALYNINKYNTRKKGQQYL